MMTVAGVAARLDEFMRVQEIANEGFTPDREAQAMINTEVRGKIAELQTRVKELESAEAEHVGDAQLQEIKDLQEKTAAESQRFMLMDGLMTEHSARVTESLAEIAKLGETMSAHKTELDVVMSKFENCVKMIDVHIVKFDQARKSSREMGQIVDTNRSDAPSDV